MTPEDLAALHPTLFHVTSEETLPNLKRFGILCAAEIIERCRSDTAAVPELLTSRRPDRVRLHDTDGNTFILSDNCPLSEKKLAAALDDGLGVADWLWMLSNRVFFWTNADQARKLISSRNNTGHRKALLRVNSLALAQRVRGRLEICPINSGSTIHRPARRGTKTFARLDDVSYPNWRRLRDARRLDRIKEVTVVGNVPDIMEFSEIE